MISHVEIDFLKNSKYHNKWEGMMEALRSPMLWLCKKTFKPFRGFRVELNRKLEKVESILLKNYYEYEIAKKKKLKGEK